MTVYVGTYTDGTSRGIYRVTFDPATGAMTEPVLAVETKNPSFLALHPSGRFLYAVGEISSFEGAKTGAVSAFAIDPKTGDLTLLNQQPSEGAGPCHLVVDKSGPQRLVANYGGGTWPSCRSGRRAPEARLVGPRPRGLRPEHGAAGEAARSRDLPRRRRAVRLLARPRRRPRLRLPLRRREGHARASRCGPVRPRLGPRHLAFHPAGKYVYVIKSSLDGHRLRLRRGEGGARHVQTISTLPAGFAGTSWTAEVAVSPDGRFVYGSNRGDDSLAVFARDETTGRLPCRAPPVGRKNPRHFTFDPTGRYLLAAHQGSDTIGHCASIETGLPTRWAPLKVGKPVCLLPCP